jgi:hypothetical protein
MCRALVDGADLASFAGGPFDVRAVVAGIEPGADSRLLFDAVPWGNFPHGDDARKAVHTSAPTTWSSTPTPVTEH